MSRIITLAAALVLGAGLAVHAQDAKVQKGAEVYAAQKCSMCHSIAGKGNAKGALDGIGSKLSAAEIRQWLTDPEGMTKKSGATRKPPMKVKKLSAEELDALVAYLQTLKTK